MSSVKITSRPYVVQNKDKFHNKWIVCKGFIGEHKKEEIIFIAIFDEPFITICNKSVAQKYYTYVDELHGFTELVKFGKYDIDYEKCIISF